MGTTAHARQAGSRMCSSALFSLQSSGASPLWNFLKRNEGSLLLSVQNTDEGMDRRIFQPPCMKPMYATLGTLSLQHTISRPQSAPAAAWPGFDAVSTRCHFLCPPCTSATSAVCCPTDPKVWGRAAAPNKPPTCRDPQPKKLCKRALPYRFACCTSHLLCRYGALWCGHSKSKPLHQERLL